MSSKSESPRLTLPIPTPEGVFVARYSSVGLSDLWFPSSKQPRILDKPANLPSQVREWHCLTSAALAEALKGAQPNKNPAFDLSCGTDFQQQVWGALQQIDCGQTWSYAEVAEAIRRPRALRAVGNACGENPIPVLIPCHRVVGSNGLGGFSAGLRWKRLLLEREGVCIDETRTQRSLALGA